MRDSLAIAYCGPAAVPGDLERILRPYQRQGVDWLAFCRDLGLGCVLADDMGLGKTLQALASLKGRTLVVGAGGGFGRILWNLSVVPFD